MILMICSGLRANISFAVVLCRVKSRIPPAPGCPPFQLDPCWQATTIECNDTQDLRAVCCMSIYLQLPTSSTMTLLTTAASNESVGVCALIFKRLHGNLLTPTSRNNNPQPRLGPGRAKKRPCPRRELKVRQAPREPAESGSAEGGWTKRVPKGDVGVALWQCGSAAGWQEAARPCE